MGNKKKIKTAAPKRRLSTSLLQQKKERRDQRSLCTAMPLMPPISFGITRLSKDSTVSKGCKSSSLMVHTFAQCKRQGNTLWVGVTVHTERFCAKGLIRNEEDADNDDTRKDYQQRGRCGRSWKSKSHLPFNTMLEFDQLNRVSFTPSQPVQL